MIGFTKVGGTRVVPLHLKIVLVMTVLVLVSNMGSNFVNLVLNRGEQVKLLNTLLVRDLTELYIFAGNQLEIYNNYDKNLESSARVLRENSLHNLNRSGSSAFGINPDGSFLFFSSPTLNWTTFPDAGALQLLEKTRAEGTREGTFTFTSENRLYKGLYKYHPGWKVYLVRAEDQEVFNEESMRVFWSVSLLILAFSLIVTVVTIFILQHMFRFVDKITDSLMAMQKNQQLGMIDLPGAPNDDITYLGMSFNSLSVTIRNLLTIFRRFVTQDVADKAYKERIIRLEGQRKVLTILFTDIRGFTFMTETLGNDIIRLLNLHYDRAIHHIQEKDGIVGSIIGDALLAVYGTLEGAYEQKSLKALESAFQIQKVAEELRTAMKAKRAEILRDRGELTPLEEDIYRAVLLEVGVGIDGGEVFYGNIGSYERMANTVIGDNVNSASRLEGLTRIYQVPIIVSDFVRQEVTKDSQAYRFVELDRVQVKGKTEGKQIYWPVEKSALTPELSKKIDLFESALPPYYQGDWSRAEPLFRDSGLEFSRIFLDRIKGQQVPKNWNGIWTMNTK